MAATVGLRVIHIATRCATADDFVHRFWQFCGDDTMQVPATDGVMKGTVSRFVMTLSNGDTALGGRMQVLETFEKLGTTYLRARLLDLDDASHSVHGRMLKTRSEKLPAQAAAQRGLPPPRPPGAGGPPPIPGAPPAAPRPVHEPDFSQMSSLVSLVSFNEEASTDATVPVAGVPAAESTPIRVTPTGPLDEERTPRPTSLSDDVPLLIPPQTLRASAGTGTTAGNAAGKLTGKAMVARSGAELGVWGALAPLMQRVPEAYRPAVRQWAPFVLTAMVFFVFGRWTAGDAADSTGATTQGAAPAAATSAQVADRDSTDIAGAAVEPGGETAGAVDDGNALTAAAAKMPDCRATIDSEPAGAPVMWGDRELGNTPLEGVKVPCGRALVAIAHPRYEKVVRSVSVSMDEMQLIREKLKRPEATVLLTSSPSAATIWVDETEVGATPGRLGVKRYEALRLRVEKPGFEPWSREVYVDQIEKVLDVRLRPQRKAARNAKRR